LCPTGFSAVDHVDVSLRREWIQCNTLLH